MVILKKVLFLNCLIGGSACHKKKKSYKNGDRFNLKQRTFSNALTALERDNIFLLALIKI